MTVAEISAETRDIGQYSSAAYGSTKIQGHHLDRLAVVYVRQSTPHQVIEHRESGEVQYNLAHRAVALGWRKDRVLVIDDDQGESASTAVNRIGFQRLLAEVGMNHVGLVLGIEMSRLARSCKDWYQLLELCAIFQSLLADFDGLYNPGNYNDRLLLGLKGTMSEAELHILSARMEQGKLNKARRGELFYAVPMGYVRLPSDEVALDPDEQAQSVVRLLFEKFTELGSCRQLTRYLTRNDIRMPVRARHQPNRGQLEWHVANAGTLYGILHNPIYAGAYAHGRSVVDPRRKIPGKRNSGKTKLPIDKWAVLRKDTLPAYITWEGFLANQERLRQNCASFHTKGAPRRGSAILGGLLVCGCCDWRMYVNYNDKPNRPRYVCNRVRKTFVGHPCPNVAARVVDELVSRQVLKALQPAALELSIEAEAHIRREQGRLEKQWQQRLERARYQTERAKRQFDAVEPENRLVARELERRWELTLAEEQHTREEYARYQNDQGRGLSSSDLESIRALASDIPALWDALSTTFADRQTIVRYLVERVVINVQGETEVVDVTIQWAGGFVSEHEIIRSVRCYEQLRDYDRLIALITELSDAGCTREEIANRLNAKGFHSPKRDHRFTPTMVRQLLVRRGLTKPRGGRTLDKYQRDSNEWWIDELSQELGIPKQTLDRWCRKGWINARKLTVAGRRWVIWADTDELQRLRKLRASRRRTLAIPYPQELTTPKKRPE